MDLAAVEEMGRFLQSKADELRRLAAEIDRSVQSTTWTGADADRFCHDWWPAHRSRVVDAADRVHGLGQSALNNASEQGEASGAGGAGAGGAAASSDSSIDWGAVLKVAGWADLIGGGILDASEVAALIKSGASVQVIPGVGTVISGGLGIANVIYTGSEHGWGSGENVWAVVDGVGGTAASLVPGGGVAWWVGTNVGEWIAEESMEANDAFVSSVTGTDEHYEYALWLHRNYGVYDSDDLTTEQAFQASSEYSEQVNGWSGLWHIPWNGVQNSFWPLIGG